MQRHGYIARPHILNIGTRWSSDLHAPFLSPSVNYPLVGVGQDAEWTPEAVETRRQTEESLPLPGDQTSHVQPVASKFTDSEMH
jgi:hypothetical protein